MEAQIKEKNMKKPKEFRMQVFEERHGYKALQEKREAKAAKEREEARKSREEELERRRSSDLLLVRKVFSTEQRQKYLDNQYNSYMRKLIKL